MVTICLQVEMLTILPLSAAVIEEVKFHRSKDKNKRSNRIFIDNANKEEFKSVSGMHLSFHCTQLV
jgi:hypothetical protein